MEPKPELTEANYDERLVVALSKILEVFADQLPSIVTEGIVTFLMTGSERHLTGAPGEKFADAAEDCGLHLDAVRDLLTHFWSIARPGADQESIDSTLNRLNEAEQALGL